VPFRRHRRARLILFFLAAYTIVMSQDALLLRHLSRRAFEGWLLTFVYDHVTDTSDLVILDALNVVAAPVNEIRTPRRVPHGFHGVWIPPLMNSLARSLITLSFARRSCETYIQAPNGFREDGHSRSRGAPHSGQNLRPDRF
jgi:hypothetical protein